MLLARASFCPTCCPSRFAYQHRPFWQQRQNVTPQLRDLPTGPSVGHDNCRLNEHKSIPKSDPRPVSSNHWWQEVFQVHLEKQKARTRHTHHWITCLCVCRPFSTPDAFPAHPSVKKEHSMTIPASIRSSDGFQITSTKPRPWCLVELQGWPKERK